MNKTISLITMLILIMSMTSAGPAWSGPEDRFIVLNYHDIEDDPETQRLDDAVTLSSRQLAIQFDWLQMHGYTVVSLDDIVAARDGRKTLPDKAVLLTFDDGYLSMYTRVFPLLKLYHYPAVVGLVTSWMETAEGREIRYGKSKIKRRHFMSWKQVNEMIKSGLVEVASHSNDLHHGLLASPQGSLLPAATNRQYDPHGNHYEKTAAFHQRIRRDLEKSRAVIRRHTGRAPRALIWPYGSYSAEVVAIARQAGMPITMTLDDGVNVAGDLSTLKRLYVYNDMPLDELVRQLHGLYWPIPQRVVQVDLDLIYDADADQLDRNLGRLLQRLKSLDVNSVYLQAYADPDGDGCADALYFPNRHLPVRADLFGRVADALRDRAGVKVYAWLPVLSYKPRDNSGMQTVITAQPGSATGNMNCRLSPFDNKARQWILELYEDLAQHADFDGLLFHDDAVLSDFEDDSAAAREVYSRQWDLPDSVAAIRADPEQFKNWTALKTKWLIDWTRKLAEQVRHYRPRIRTARNLFAEVALNPQSENWYAQSLPAFLHSYDYTAVMAMPFMENARRPDAWLRDLVTAIGRQPGALAKTVFELQSLDWRTDVPVNSGILAGQMWQLQYNGALNFGYYPDNHVDGYPDISTLIPAMSLQTFPYPEPGTGTGTGTGTQ